MFLIKLLLRCVFAGFFIATGVTHFTGPEFFLKIMPDNIPQNLHLACVYVSGVAEILLGVMLLIPPTIRLAGWGLIALLIAVFPANIYAYQHTLELFPNLDPKLHFWRLPLQAVMIFWAWCYTRPGATANDAAQELVDPT